jgi:2-phosphoglycerate kinase
MRGADVFAHNLPWPAFIIVTGVVTAFVVFVLVMMPDRETHSVTFVARCAVARYSGGQCAFLYAFEQRRTDHEFTDQAALHTAMSAATAGST